MGGFGWRGAVTLTFDEWYSQTVAPLMPIDAPAALKQASREQMAACWNAALDSVAERHSSLSDREMEVLSSAEFVGPLRAAPKNS